MEDLDFIFDEKIFMNLLYDFLNIGEICFLSGAFVIEDSNNVLFKLLTYGKYKDNEYKITRNRGTKCFISHDSFLTDKLYQKKKDQLQNTKYIINDNYAYKKLGLSKLFSSEKTLSMYERLIINGNELNCSGISKIFKVILYYPFRIKQTNNNNNYIEYIYLKFETSPCFTKNHIHKYISSKMNISNNKLIKRQESKKYTTNLKHIDEQFINKIFNKYSFDHNKKEEIFKKIDNYNKYIRVGSELYLPNEFLNIILVNTINEIKERFNKILKDTYNILKKNVLK